MDDLPIRPGPLGGRAAASRAAHRLVGVPILEQLDHDVVELDEPHVEALGAAPQVRNADRARIDPKLAGYDLLVSQQSVLDGAVWQVARPGGPGGPGRWRAR